MSHNSMVCTLSGVQTIREYPSCTGIPVWPYVPKNIFPHEWACIKSI